jgi:hypothetical protein
VTGCDISHVSQGIISASTIVSNTIHDGGYSHEALEHENAIYVFGSGTVAGNVVHDWAEGTCIYLSPVWLGAGTNYCYNNVIWNTGVIPITPTEERGGGQPETGDGRVYIYNNTTKAGTTCVRVASRPELDFVTLDIRNNLFISDGSPAVNIEPTGITELTVSDNYTNTAAWAAANGLTIANKWQPGASLTGVEDAGATLTLFSNDFLNVTRPQGAGWDIGAYEYPSGTPAPPAPSGSATVSGALTVDTIQ